MVVSGSSDNTIRLWDIECGQCLRVLEGHEELVRCIRLIKIFTRTVNVILRDTQFRDLHRINNRVDVVLIFVEWRICQFSAEFGIENDKCSGRE